MNIKQIHIVGTVSKSNNKIIERGNIEYSIHTYIFTLVVKKKWG
jgi:hypothetical protein